MTVVVWAGCGTWASNCKPGRLAADYFINTVTGECDCPDFAKHGDFCKHTIAAELVDEDAHYDAMAAQYADPFAAI